MPEIIDARLRPFPILIFARPRKPARSASSMDDDEIP
jgi:hypothetical protein